MPIRHLARPKNLFTLFKYSLSGTCAVAVDVSILYLLHGINVPNAIAVCVSAGVSTFVHYVISRYFVFRSFRRSFLSGLVYFVSIIGVSVGFNIALYFALMLVIPDHFIVARVTSIALVGLLSFFLNARYTFKKS